MADTKLSALTELSTLSATDHLYVSPLVTGTRRDRRMTAANLASGVKLLAGSAGAVGAVGVAVGTTTVGLFSGGSGATEYLALAANGVEFLRSTSALTTLATPLARVQATEGTAIRFLSITPATSGRGPFALSYDSSDFSGVKDPAMYFGYNSDPGGVPIVAGEPAFYIAMEANYNDGSGDNKMEAYWHFIGSDGTTTSRPHFMSWNRDTHKIAGHSLKGDQIKFLADDAEGEAGTNTFTFDKNNLTIHAPTAGAGTNLYLKAASGQTALLSLGYNGTDGYWQQYIYGANTARMVLNTRVMMSLYSTPLGGTGAAISVGAEEGDAAGTFKASFASHKGLVARGATSQSANIFEVQNSASTVLVSVTPSGDLIGAGGLALGGATAPSNGIQFGTSAPSVLANGQVWYDGTNLKARIGGATVTIVVA